MIDMTLASQLSCIRLSWKHNFAREFRKCIFVVLRDLPPPFRPLLEIRELFQEHCSLNGIHPKIATNLRMIITGIHSVVSQDFHLAPKIGITRHSHPGIAEGTKILCRIKTEKPELTH